MHADGVMSSTASDSLEIIPDKLHTFLWVTYIVMISPSPSPSLEILYRRVCGSTGHVCADALVGSEGISKNYVHAYCGQMMSWWVHTVSRLPLSMLCNVGFDWLHNSILCISVRAWMGRLHCCAHTHLESEFWCMYMCHWGYQESFFFALPHSTHMLIYYA